MPEHYKLTYFNGRGRAEPIRLIFAYAGQNYEDHRIEMKDWPTMKANTPSGVLPFLEISENQRLSSAHRHPSAVRSEYNENNYVLCQSAAIARSLGRKFHLAGRTSREHAEVDMFVDQCIDIVNELVKLRRSQAQPPEKEAEQKKFETENLPKYLSMFEQRLHRTGKNSLVPSGITIADLYLFSTFEWLGPSQQEFLAKYPGIKRVIDDVKSHEHVSAYLAKRPQTPF